MSLIDHLIDHLIDQELPVGLLADRSASPRRRQGIFKVGARVRGMRQTQALSIMLSGSSVFLTGAPGAGKSFVLRRFVRRSVANGINVAITASTGIAATHIGGVTIHSWSGIGVRDTLTEKDIHTISSRPGMANRYRQCDVVVIDEISMLPGRFLDAFNLLCQTLRSDPRPFGGLQVVLVGDMFQLPPISRGSSEVDFAHESAAWKQLDPEICYLTEQHRQGDDDLYRVLSAMRDGSLSEEHVKVLTETIEKSQHAHDNLTRLYSHNADVDAINALRLQSLQGETTEYLMSSRGSPSSVDQLVRGVLAPQRLELKVGAEVMFVANSPNREFFNGTRGKVIGFEGGKPKVQLLSGSTIVVERHTWRFEGDQSPNAEISQVPLRLAWAITIHKSQGMSLDEAVIDLGRSFAPGMGYVALSRLRSLGGLYLLGLNDMALRLHPELYELDQKLLRLSERLGATTPDYLEEDPAPALPRPTYDITDVDTDLLSSLRRWRQLRSQADGVPAYVVAHNSQLEEIAARLPEDEAALLTIKGIGPSKVRSYGDDILALVRAKLPPPTLF